MTAHPKASSESAQEQLPGDLIHLRDQLFNSFVPEVVNADLVIEYANALYLSDKKAWHWLGKHCPALAGRPIDFLSTPKGCGQVMQVLFAMYHSVYL